MKQEILNKIIEYAISCHMNTNHLYDGKPYVLHQLMVVGSAYKFIDCIPELVHNEIYAACWLHDVMEDCRQTYNDVALVAGKEVAEIVYAVTNEKGRSRKERANEKYYEGIKNTAWATFVKLCDRIANVEYSKNNKSRMFEMYKKEQTEFIAYLSPPGYYKPLVSYLDQLLNLDQEAQASVATEAK